MNPTVAFFICLILGAGAIWLGPAALPACLGILGVCSGLIALVTTDSLGKAVSVIFGQLFLVFAIYRLFEFVGVLRVLGEGGVLTCCSMTIVATLNLTSSRLSLMSFGWFLILDIIFSVRGATSLEPNDLRSLAFGPVVAALSSALLGALILFGPVIVGGVARLWQSPEKPRKASAKLEWD